MEAIGRLQGGKSGVLGCASTPSAAPKFTLSDFETTIRSSETYVTQAHRFHVTYVQACSVPDEYLT